MSARIVQLHRLGWLALGLVVACAAPRAPAPRAPADAPAPPAPVDANAPRISRIEGGLLPTVQIEGEVVRRPLLERMRELEIPGLSVAVFADYQLQWARTYGVADVETGAAIGEHTLFQAGSISKSVNALAVLLAAADGTLALDRPINELLTSWKLPDNELTRATPVTLRRLLSHTAGTTVHGFPGYAVGEAVPTVQQVLDGQPPANTPAIRVDLAPGTRFRYSGGGTTITQLALAERSGRPYPEILAERVLGPLGMADSTFVQPLPPDRLQQAAAGHGRDGKDIAGKRHTYPEMAAAGLWTTPSDLARFFVAVALGRAGRSRQVPREVAEQMTTRVADVEGGAQIGLGVFLFERNGARFFGHGGADEGFQASAMASLDGGYGVIVMANSDNGSRIFDEVQRTVLAEYGWPGADPVLVRFTLAAEQRAGFVGRYLDGQLPRVVTDVAGKLEVRAPFGEVSELVPLAADAVVVRESGDRLVREASGALVRTLPGAASRTLPRMPDDARHFLLELEAGRFDAAAKLWREQARRDPKAAREEEQFVNSFAYRVLERDPAGGVEVLRLVTVVFPDSSNAHDSLGEAYMFTKDTSKAIAAYERALATLAADPRIAAAERPARRARAQAQLAELRAMTR